MKSAVACCVALAAAMFAGRAAAQTIEVTPFVGYETAGSYPLQNPIDIQALQADAARTYGLFVDYRLFTNVQAEFLWVNDKTTYSAAYADPSLFTRAFDTSIDEYQIGMLYHLRDRDAVLRPYLAAGLGVTHDSNGGAFPDRSAFGFSAGGGLKYQPTAHIGVRLDGRYMPTYGSSQLGNVCDFYGYCYADTFASYLQRISLTAGVIIGL